jgi:transposase-like protein
MPKGKSLSRPSAGHGGQGHRQRAHRATVYQLERLRCNLCGEIFTAKAPEGMGDEKYDAASGAMIALLKYGSGLPFNRLLLFTDEFKRNAVQFVLDNGYSYTEVARRLNVNHTNISRWVRQYRDQSETSVESSSQPNLEAEVKRLKKENQRLLMERDILKKAAAFFAKESK